MFFAYKVIKLFFAQTSDPDNHGILTPANHGLRREHWCRTQLVTIHDITKCLDHREQGDMAVFDFNKAFDNIPHQHLLSNLEFCGITGKAQNWIDAFLISRTQSMTIEGHCSRGDCVGPGVLQGAVLGPLLLLIFVSDLPNIVDPIQWSTCLPMTMSSTTQSEARWINSSYITTSTPFTGGDNAVVCRICSSTPRNVISWGLEMWLEQWQFKLDLILLGGQCYAVNWHLLNSDTDPCSPSVYYCNISSLQSLVTSHVYTTLGIRQLAIFASKNKPAATSSPNPNPSFSCGGSVGTVESANIRHGRHTCWT